LGKSVSSGSDVSQYNADQFVDCMIDLDLPGTTGQLRYQNVKGRLGPKTVIRILRTGDESRIGFADAGYAPSHLRLLRLAARAGKGIVLLAGVTSSGKSTSLKSFIETMPGLDQKAIYTVEDPIEYEIAGAHQIEVLRDIANDDETRRRYAEVMRALMRSDPDGVMLGEIRDKLTALFALQIAETGHLAMGTVHAHLVSNIIPRLTNDQIGISRQALTGPNIINLLVYQALVPTLCRHCALPTAHALALDPDVAEIDEVLRRRFRLPTSSLRWARPGGCAACAERGTRGKTIVAEMLQPDRTWLRHVRHNDDDAALQHFRSTSDRAFDSPDMTGKTVFEHALFKALRGEIDARTCEEFDGFERFEILPPHHRRAMPVEALR
jgi:type II secretory ATPase GspE/PulE/Tfp pilus assembly ATPase PilB-like protein